VINLELQVVLSTLAEHNFQVAFKKLQKCSEWCIHLEEDYFDGGQKAQSYFLTRWQQKFWKLFMAVFIMCTVQFYSVLQV
jgi:hypothetical protein